MKKITLGLMALFALAATLVPGIAAACAAGDISMLFSIDWAALGAGGMLLADGAAMPISEQIKQYEAKRQAAQDRATELLDLSVKEGRTLDEHETEQHDEAMSEVDSIDKHLSLLSKHEKRLLQKATVIDAASGRGDDVTKGSAVDIGNTRLIQLKTNLPPGLRFTRFSLAMAQSKGNVMMAHEIAKARWPDTPEVAHILKASVALGGTRELFRVEKAAVTVVSTTDTAVQQYTDIQDEFIELLRPKEIMGRMNSLTRVPFNSRVGRQLTGVLGQFVGEGLPKPVGKQTYDNITLAPLKIAIIVVLTEESVRFSTIKAEMRARDDIIKGIATYKDKRFMDPAYSGVANVSPASITNGAARVQASGTSAAAISTDVKAAMAMFSESNVDPATAVWVMSAASALSLSMKLNANEEPLYPTISMTGGTWFGLPVIISSAMVASGSPSERQIALVTQEEVLLAEDGGVTIDMSNEASVQMNDAPSAGAQSLVSLWQNNLVGIRAEMFTNWAAARPSNLGIALIENSAY